MRVHRIRIAFFLLTVFASVLVADAYDSVPCEFKSTSQTLSIQSNDLPSVLANTHTRNTSEVCSAYVKTFITPDFQEIKRFYSTLVQICFERNISSLVERPATALYVLLLRILI